MYSSVKCLRLRVACLCLLGLCGAVVANNPPEEIPVCECPQKITCEVTGSIKITLTDNKDGTPNIEQTNNVNIDAGYTQKICPCDNSKKVNDQPHSCPIPQVAVKFSVENKPLTEKYAYDAAGNKIYIVKQCVKRSESI